MAEFVKPPGQVYNCFNEATMTSQAGSVKFEKVFLGHDYGDVNPAFAIIGFANNCFYIEDVFDNSPNISQELLDLWGAVNNKAMEESDQIELFKKLCRQYSVRKIFTGHDRPSRLLTIRRIGAEFNIEGMRKAVVGKPVTQTYPLINSLYHAGMIKVSTKCVVKGLPAEIMSYKRETDKNGIVIDEIEKKSTFHRLDAIAYVIGTIGERYNILHRNTNKAVNIEMIPGDIFS
jgi:hypothetical protein